MITDPTEVYEFVSGERSKSFRIHQINENHAIKIQEINYKSTNNLWKELKTIRGNSTTRFEFIVTVISVCIKDVGYLLLTSLVSFCMICIGLTYITDCPTCIFIPIYLIITGILGITNQFVNYRINRRPTDLLENHHKESIILKLTFIFLWFTIGGGSYWVFKIFQPNYTNTNNINYCNKIVYLFAFCITILIYFFLLFVPCLTFIISRLIKYLCKRKNKDTVIMSGGTTIATGTIQNGGGATAKATTTIVTSSIAPTTPTINKTNICLI